MKLYAYLMLGTILCGSIHSPQLSTKIEMSNKKGKILSNCIFIILWAISDMQTVNFGVLRH